MMIRTLLMRDVRLAFGRGGVAWASLAFMLVASTLFTFSLGPEALQQHAAQLLWMLALFSSLLLQPSIFEKDADDGTLDQLRLLPLAPESLVLTKIIAHWLAAILPLLALTPVIGIFAGFETAQWQGLLVSLLLGTPALACITALGAALTLGSRRGAAVQALVTLPLYIPTLIFASAMTAGAGPVHLGALLGLALLSLPCACIACAWLILQSD